MTKDEAQEFIGHFYQAGDITGVPDAILALAEAGSIHGQPTPSWWASLQSRWRKVAQLSVDQWSRKSDYPVIAFLAEVLRLDGAEPSAWYARFKLLPERQRRSIWLAYWHSGHAEALETLTNAAGQASVQDRWWLQALETLTPVPFLQLPVAGPGTLDIWWACFSATADLNAVTNVVNALGFVAEKEGTPMHAIGVSALWSLKSQASQHELVAAHVRGLLADVTDEGMRLMLEGVLAEAPVEA